MYRKEIYGTRLASNCFLPTFWWHGRWRFYEREWILQIAYETPCRLTRRQQMMHCDLDPNYCDWHSGGPLSDLVLCGLHSRNTQRDKGPVNRTRLDRNQHWIFWNSKSSTAIFGHRCKELARNEKEWWVGLYGLYNGQLICGEKGHDPILYICRGQLSVAKPREDLFRCKIQWPARGVWLQKSKGLRLGIMMEMALINYKCREHAFSREKVGATSVYSANGHFWFLEVCQAINAQ